MTGGIHSFEDGFEAARQHEDELIRRNTGVRSVFDLVDNDAEPIPFELTEPEVCTHKMDEHTISLTIEEGEVNLLCNGCKKPPGWMEDHRECLTMDDSVVIKVVDNNGGVPGHCGCNQMLQWGCDCGPDFRATPVPVKADEPVENTTKYKLEKLARLEAAGVDNWEGYDDAMS